MFGLIISGRPVDATPTAITETQYAFRIPSTSSFSHIVVFLLPGAQLLANTAATVYIQIPPSEEFKLLGGIGPGKESAIFKVSGLKSNANTNAAAVGDGDAMTDDPSLSAGFSGPTAAGDIVVGLSIEPATQVDAQIQQLKGPQPIVADATSALVRHSSNTGGRASTKVLAQRIIGNAFNFLASFGSDVVPLKAFEEWWKKFEKKVELDPSFLERSEQD